MIIMKYRDDKIVNQPLIVCMIMRNETLDWKTAMSRNI